MMRYLDEYRGAPDQIEDFLDRPSLALLAVADGSGPEVGVFPFLHREGRVEMHLERSDAQVDAIERAGRGTVVISERLSTIPSHWVDPERAAARLNVVSVSASEIRVKFKLGQQLSEAARRRIIAGLQERGSELDQRTADLVAATLENRAPSSRP